MTLSSNVPLGRFHAMEDALGGADDAPESVRPSTRELQSAVAALASSLHLLVNLVEELREEIMLASPESVPGRDFAKAAEKLQEATGELRNVAGLAQIAHVRVQGQSKTSKKFLVE